MTETRRTRPGAGLGAPYSGSRRPARTGWRGWITFTSVMLIIVGLFQGVEGLVAIVNDDYYLAAGDDLIVSLDHTAWGWVHLLLAVVIAGAGIGVLLGQLWARVVGILVAALSATANVAFLAAYPVGTTIIIAIDVVVIYALTVHGQEAADDYA